MPKEEESPLVPEIPAEEAAPEGADVQELPPPPAEPGDPSISPEDLGALREELAKSTETITKLTKQLSKLTEKHAEEMEEIRSQLPKISRDSKATVEGYFDFDVRANRLLDEAAKSDFDRAVEDFAMLGTIFR